MPRRRVIAKREILPDPKFNNIMLAKFMNHVMVSGKKSVAERIVYGAMSVVEERLKRDPLEIFEEALDNVAPIWQKQIKLFLIFASKLLFAVNLPSSITF